MSQPAQGDLEAAFGHHLSEMLWYTIPNFPIHQECWKELQEEFRAAIWTAMELRYPCKCMFTVHLYGFAWVNILLIC